MLGRWQRLAVALELELRNDAETFATQHRRGDDLPVQRAPGSTHVRASPHARS